MKLRLFRAIKAHWKVLLIKCHLIDYVQLSKQNNFVSTVNEKGLIPDSASEINHKRLNQGSVSASKLLLGLFYRLS
jgi:hypothetical protein